MTRIIALAVVAALLIGTAALAAAPQRGATYRGTVGDSSAYKLSFRVSASGKRVSNVRATVYQTCQGEPGRINTFVPGRSFTVRGGRFSGEGSSNGARWEFAGRFGRNGTATGTLLMSGGAVTEPSAHAAAFCTTFEKTWSARAR